MGYSTIPKVRRDGSITLKDGTSSTVSLLVAYEEGALSFDLAKPADQTVIRDRGTIVTVRKGDDQPSATGSFTAFMRQFTSSSAGSILDFINKTAGSAYAANESVARYDKGRTPVLEEYAIDIEYDVEGSDFGDTDGDHKAILKSCICTASFSEGDPSSFTINFTCYGGVEFQ